MIWKISRFRLCGKKIKPELPNWTVGLFILFILLFFVLPNIVFSMSILEGFYGRCFQTYGHLTPITHVHVIQGCTEEMLLSLLCSFSSIINDFIWHHKLLQPRVFWAGDWMYKDYKGKKWRFCKWEPGIKVIPWEKTCILLWFVCCISATTSLWRRKFLVFIRTQAGTRGSVFYSTLLRNLLLYYICICFDQISCGLLLFVIRMCSFIADSYQDGDTIWMGAWWQPCDLHH